MYLVTFWSISPMSSHLCLLFLTSLPLSSQLGLDDVFFSPQDQTACEGDTVFFPCVSGESSPPASISWLKDGKPVSRGRQIQGEYGGGSQRKTSGTLHLYNITLEDDGIYTCITYNSLLRTSKRSKSAKLTVQGVPRRLQIILGPDNRTVAMGEEVSMHCAVGGFPVPMVQWFKDGCLVTNCSASFMLHNNGQLLTFRNVSKDNEGFYHCEAYNQRERVMSQTGFLLLADMDWSFVKQPVNVTVVKGENVTVTCRPPDSRPPAQVSWFKNNQLLVPSAHVYVLSTGDLFLHGVNEHDSGSYFCRASNIHLQRFVTSRRATVTVRALPSVTLQPQVLTVPVGARVELHCQAFGSPLPSINWFKSGQSKQTGGKVVKGSSNATLYIQSARSYDEGVYVCHASNSLGSSQQNAVLKVAVSPIIVNFTTQVHSRIGAPVTLPCKAVGIGPITYTWSKKRGTLPLAIAPNEKISIDGEGSLHISDVQWSNEGEYYCTAKNRAGQHQKRSFLTVTFDQRPTDTVVLSANSSTLKTMVALEKSVAEQHLVTVPHQTKQKQTSCVSSNCLGSMEDFTKDYTTSSSLHILTFPSIPSQYFVTQMPPPIFPPPPHLNFKSSGFTDQPSASSNHPFTEFLILKNPLKSTTSEHSGPTQAPHHTTISLFKALSELPVSTSYDFVETSSPFVSQTSLVTLSPTLQIEIPNNNANPLLLRHDEETTSTQIPETKLDPPRDLMHLKQGHHPSPSPSTLHIHPGMYSTSKERQDYENLFPPAKPTPSTALQLQPPVFPTQQSHLNALSPDYTTSYSIDSLAAISNPVNHTYNASALDSTLSVANVSQPQNTSDEEKSMAATEKNTSQSPRVTQKVPSWLPVLEKHDIPVVVGVGVSLAFIFITVTFYSIVQKNEPVPTSRAAQRNVGVPIRHTGRRAAGRTYENRAFEDDDCVAVAEQSPNTRARPPGPSLVTVQLEPTSEELQEDIPSSPDLHSVTIETYPEPILDTKIDDCLEEESGLSLSQPSIQLQCAEDWLSADDNHGPSQDTLPPLSPLVSPSPSPSLSSKQTEGICSSLTLQSSELSTAPLHHSLSVSRGPSPLLLSHHVSVGPTNVAVDVHFHPVSTPSFSVQTTTQINTSSVVTAPHAGNQECPQ